MSAIKIIKCHTQGKARIIKNSVEIHVQYKYIIPVVFICFIFILSFSHNVHVKKN